MSTLLLSCIEKKEEDEKEEEEKGNESINEVDTHVCLQHNAIM